MAPCWHRAPITCRRSNRMMENSGVSVNKELLDSTCSLSDQELTLVMMFRVINKQRQQDILRILEVFNKLSDS